MVSMEFDIRIGQYALRALESVTVRRSVETLADTAEITLPAVAAGRTQEVRSKVRESDPVVIRLGYDRVLPVEFEGCVSRIAAEGSSVRIACEDALSALRCPVRDAVLEGVTVREVLEHVLREAGHFRLACDYDFRYDRFTLYRTTAYDVVRQVRQETRADIYLRQGTLHVHPQQTPVGRQVIYDFARNIERSELRYGAAEQRPLLATVEGTDAAGRTIRAERGTAGGDTFTLRLPGVSDPAALAQRAAEELSARRGAGYAGSFTAWLVPQAEPGDRAVVRDAAHADRTGSYFIAAVETTFNAEGGRRKITLGRKLD